MLPLIGLGLAVAGQIGSGAAQASSRRSAANAARANAIAAEIATLLKVKDLKDAGERLESSQRAAAAFSGLDIASGSPAAVQIDTAGEIEKEIHRVKYSGALSVSGAMTESDAFKKAAGYAYVGGVLKGGATAIQGYGQMKDNTVAPMSTGGDS